MGLLDRLAGNLIAESVGLPPGLARGLVRRAMGNEAMLMGGAALAGVLVSELMHNQQQQQPPWGAPPPPPGAAPGWVPPPPPPGAPPAWAPPPPPPDAGFVPPPPPPASGAVPPPPGAFVPPPLPPDAAVAAPSGHQPELPPQLLYAVVRTMVAAALADGILAPAERARIQEQLGSGDFPPAQADQVRKDLLLPATAEELAAMVSADGERALLYRFALLVTRIDAGISAEERAWLRRLGAALALDESRCAQLEDEMFGG